LAVVIERGEEWIQTGKPTHHGKVVTDKGGYGWDGSQRERERV
jgi:hypothetical protein